MLTPLETLQLAAMRNLVASAENEDLRIRKLIMSHLREPIALAERARADAARGVLPVEVAR
ncbi:hypothetical protein [Paenirhodobacter populi]|uniref:Uncharacterized protein n=1 Tax=Paenirhodobacter populi TaxID=2306993 RepID=A0A443J7G7_9RHOB|nr:hypothetical protein [Sinirhodobacter populi]RWR16406.1 hypothetical protein D2T30_21685 [Sinirhodobacter populi]